MIRSKRTTLAVVAVVFALLAVALAGPAIADKKDRLKEQRRGVNGQISGAKKAYDQSSKKFARAAAALHTAQRKLDAAEAHLSDTRGQLATAEARDAQMQAKLVKTEAELDAAVARLDQGKQELHDSEVAVEQFTVESLQSGDRGLQAFSDLLRGENPTKFSQQMSLSESVSDAQLATMQRLEASKVILKLHRQKVEKLRDQVAAERAAAAANLERKQRLEASAEDQADEVDQLVDDRAKARDTAARIKREDEKQLRELERERARLNARLARLARHGGKGAGGDGIGTLSRPVNGPITSSYGMRKHPITGVYKLHDGTDFGVGCGTPVHAAAAGKIIEQYYNAGYGNRVILNNGIKRGKNIVTTYNHLSRYAKSRGAHVSRGEVIGYVGSTGYSTGCHMHFMVIANGHTTNPMNWL